MMALSGPSQRLVVTTETERSGTPASGNDSAVAEGVSPPHEINGLAPQDGDGVAIGKARRRREVRRNIAEDAGRLRRFLRRPTVTRAIQRWMAGSRVEGDGGVNVHEQISLAIADIDRRIAAQVNAILHHPKLQQLEASWRGLSYLVDQLDPEPPPDSGVRIRIFNVSKRDLERDFEFASEFDMSVLFKKVYEEEFGTPGGRPYGLLVGDYEIGPRDLDLLQMIRGVSAAAFSPFIAMAHPSMLDVGATSFDRIVERPFDPLRTWSLPEFIPWRSFREHPDARFIGLTLPRILQRLPYVDDGSQDHGFRFREDVSSPDGSGYLWGSSAYAFAAVIIRAYQNTGWFTDICGGPLDGVVDEHNAGGIGGLVTDLPVHSFETDAPGRRWRNVEAMRRGRFAARQFALRPSTDVVITDDLERRLDQAGLIALCRCKDAPYSIIYGTPSVQKPQVYEGRDGALATANARISAMLQYILCCSRFAHFIKVMWRDKIGSPTTPEELEYTLNDWLSDYKNDEFIDGHPLAGGSATVRPRPANPGVYDCEIFLQPHVQFDAINAQVVLRTEGPSVSKGR